jgi:hypothetical protein
MIQYAYSKGCTNFNISTFNHPSIDDIKNVVDRNLICRIFTTIYGETGSHAVPLIGYDIENNQYACHTT